MLGITTMSDRNRTRNWIQASLSVAFIWAFLVGMALLQLWPDLAKTSLQWWLLIGLGPPLYLLFEGLGSWLFSPAHGRAISQRAFSGARIVVALALLLSIFGLGGWLSSLIGRLL